MRLFTATAVWMAACVLGGGAALWGGEDAMSVPRVPPPKYWDHFLIMPWQFKTDVRKDKALYESVNLHGFHIDRRSDSLQAFARETKWLFYVDHAADKGYLKLNDKVASGIKKKKDIIVRPNSLADPQVISTVKSILKANILSAKGSTAVAYALDDEISLGSFCSPCEVDGHPNSIAGYRKFLEKMYGDIEKLNKQYGTSYKSFEEISPKSYEAFRGALQPNSLGKLNLSMWCDWRSYMDTQFAECLADLVRFANELDPDVPCGFVGGQGPCAFGGYDYRKLCKAVQWMEAYDIGGNNEILRSFWTQKSPHVQTFFSSKNPKQDSWFLWYYLSHGNRGVIGWPDGWFVNGQVSDHIKALADTFKEVQGPVSKHVIDAEFVHDPVAIYYSHPSIQVIWALDSATHGGTWPNRSSSLENTLSTSMNSRVAWLKTLEDIGIQAKFIHQDHLLDGVLEKEGYKVLLLNAAVCLSDAEAAAIKSFAAKGGTVMADYLCGICDEHGKAREKGALDDLFGVERDLSKGILGGKTLTEVDGERDYSGVNTKNWRSDEAAIYKDVAVYERGLKEAGGAKADNAGGVAVAVRNGKAVYLNLSPIGHLIKRSGGMSKDWLSFVEGLLKDAGVEPGVKLFVAGRPANATEPVFWKNGDRMTLCIVRNLGRQAAIDGFGKLEGMSDAEGRVKLKLVFASPVKKLKNERTGKEMGDGKEFEDEFVPWEANIYTFAR